jgi:hypothetical protein
MCIQLNHRLLSSIRLIEGEITQKTWKMALPDAALYTVPIVHIIGLYISATKPRVTFIVFLNKNLVTLP